MEELYKEAAPGVEVAGSLLGMEVERLVWRWSGAGLCSEEACTWRSCWRSGVESTAEVAVWK